MSQFAVYRVKDQTKAPWQLSYFEVLEQKNPIREQDYQQIYLKHAKEWKNAMEIWKHLQDTVKISDVLTINQNGEVSAYYWMRMVHIKYPDFSILYQMEL